MRKGLFFIDKEKHLGLEVSPSIYPFGARKKIFSSVKTSKNVPVSFARYQDCL